MNLGNAADVYEDIFINERMISVQNTSNYLYAKVNEIFRYEDLPLTVPKRILEGYLTKNGAAVIYSHGGDLFVTDQLPSTAPNIYGENMSLQITHRAETTPVVLDLSIGVNAVLVRNDTLCIGLDPIIMEYSVLSAQAKLTFLRNLVDLRGNYIIQAKDKNAYKSALEFERAIRRGDTAVIMAEEFDDMEGIVVHNTPISNNPATQAVELFQYIQSMYYSELGITLNNNMKREYVSSAEMEKSTGMPLIYNMLSCRLEAVRDVNAIFGLNIEVALSNEWNDEVELDAVTPVEAAPGEPGETEPTQGDFGGDPEATQEGDPEEGSQEGEPIEEEPPVEEEHTTDPDPVTAEELAGAAQAITEEELSNEEVDIDSTTDDPDPEADGSKDEEERVRVDSEADDD